MREESGKGGIGEQMEQKGRRRRGGKKRDSTLAVMSTDRTQ